MFEMKDNIDFPTSKLPASTRKTL